MIILAAGMGTRLGSLTSTNPKALVKVADKTLIEYAVDAARFIEAEKIIIVGGSGYDQLKRYLLEKKEYESSQIIVVENQDYRKGNLYSLRCTCPFIEREFFLTNVDHVFSKGMLREIRQRSRWLDSLRLFTDSKKKILLDQMKILAHDGQVEKISKTLSEYNYGYTGADFCPQNDIEHFKQVIFETYEEQASKETAFNRLIENKRKVFVEDINGHNWFEVDTPDDLNEAEKLVFQKPEEWA